MTIKIMLGVWYPIIINLWITIEEEILDLGHKRTVSEEELVLKIPTIMVIWILTGMAQWIIFTM